jgi:hypothetical protein
MTITILANVIAHILVVGVGLTIKKSSSRSQAVRSSSPAESQGKRSWMDRIQPLPVLLGAPFALDKANGMFEGDAIGSVVAGLAWLSIVVLYWVYCWSGWTGKD